MKLVCPHCAKVIDVADSLAGQTSHCSLCQGPLTVPFAPPPAPPPTIQMAGPPAPPAPLPPPPPPPPPPDPLQTTAWTPTSGYVVPPVQSSNKSAAPNKGTEVLGRLRQLVVTEALHNWLGLGALTAIFFLFFFPWVSVNVGDTTIASQSGLSVGFGMASSTPEAQFLVKGLSGSGLIVIAFLASVVGLILFAIIFVEKNVQSAAVQNMKPTLQRIGELKEPIVLGCLTLITLIFLFHYCLASFPLEQAAWSEKAGDTMLMGLKLKTDGIEKVKSAEMVGLQWLHRRVWFGLATLVALVATLWIGCHWLDKRGYTRRWPKLVIQWPGNDTPSPTFDHGPPS